MNLACFIWLLWTWGEEGRTDGSNQAEDLESW